MVMTSPTIMCIIPARMASTRFPGKPLALILGLPMIEHVRRRVALCAAVSDVIVATCDDEIRQVVEKAGGRVIMTKDTHERCTDRVAEAAAALKADIVVNIQGDEPLVQPGMVEDVIGPLLKDPALPASNLVTRITDSREFADENVPKAVMNLAGDLLYISREPIPSARKADSSGYPKFKQLGIIAFRSEFLQAFARLAPTPLEQVESVDMMRAVEHGYRVRMVETQGATIGVDVRGDIARAEKALASDPWVQRYLERAAVRGGRA
jgi:3-deoxy-manno-octulosonate cytidylyltransferase (CMP-KDO synthetase)